MTSELPHQGISEVMRNEHSGVIKCCPTDHGTADRADGETAANTVSHEDEVVTTETDLRLGRDPKKRTDTEFSRPSIPINQCLLEFILQATSHIRLTNEINQTSDSTIIYRDKLSQTRQGVSGGEPLAVPQGEPKVPSQISPAAAGHAATSNETNMASQQIEHLTDKGNGIIIRGADQSAASTDDDSGGPVVCADGAGDPAAIAADLTKFQILALATLAEKDRYGLGIKRELEAYYDKEVNHGRLYPNLDDLVDQGLIEKSERDRRTNNYSITALGETVLEHDLGWLDAKINGGDA